MTGRAPEVATAEAITALTHRLTAWGVDDPQPKAHEFIRALIAQGWRPRSRPLDPPPGRGRATSTEDAPVEYWQAKQQLRTTTLLEGEHDASEDTVA